jgi:hypothetical protein
MGGKAGTGGTTGGAGGATGGTGGSTTGGSGGTDCASQAEKCDGLDNNCNSMKDEGDPEGGVACDVPGKLGECKLGTTHCVNGTVKCVQNTTAIPEVCDGKDNNCDGIPDNPPFDDDTGNQCQTGEMGVCAAGTVTCVNGATKCVRNLQPSATETCNGLDDNCDGTTDEGSPGAGMSCTVVIGGVPNKGECAVGVTGCGANGQLDCIQQNQATSELCDNKDNDCNGSIDDNVSLPSSCDVPGEEGECKKGTPKCFAGAIDCQKTVNSKPEICDKLDNDCNGTPDDGDPTVMCDQAGSHASQWECNGGLCSLVKCAPGYADIDNTFGCECATDLNPSECALAQEFSVPVGGQPQDISGVVETGDGVDWIAVKFTDNGVGKNWHPTLVLGGPSVSEYAMDVYADCASLFSCDDGLGGNVLTWELAYASYTAGDGCCNDNLVPRVTTVKVRIRRKDPSAAPTCNRYHITASSPLGRGRAPAVERHCPRVRSFQDRTLDVVRLPLTARGAERRTERRAASRSRSPSSPWRAAPSPEERRASTGRCRSGEWSCSGSASR